MSEAFTDTQRDFHPGEEIEYNAGELVRKTKATHEDLREYTDRRYAAEATQDALRKARDQLAEQMGAADPVPRPGETGDEAFHRQRVQLDALTAGVETYGQEHFDAGEKARQKSEYLDLLDRTAAGHYDRSRGSYEDAALYDAQGKVDAEGNPYDINFGSKAGQDT